MAPITDLISCHALGFRFVIKVSVQDLRGSVALTDQQNGTALNGFSLETSLTSFAGCYADTVVLHCYRLKTDIAYLQLLPAT
ncbi:MAG TPA: hypothetical protein VLA40_08085 [Rheinheimera sp.]|nr:hypothetical protein [Rheinheimera sp.]